MSLLRNVCASCSMLQHCPRAWLSLTPSWCPLSVRSNSRTLSRLRSPLRTQHPCFSIQPPSTDCGGPHKPSSIIGALRSLSRPACGTWTMASAAAVSTESVRLGLVGAGQMAEALARGWASAGVISPSSMCAFDVSEARLAVMQALGVRTVANTTELARESSVIFLAVKPFTVEQVLRELQSSQALSPSHLVVSIAAGVTLGQMEAWAGAGTRIVRVMPNTPCLVGATAAAMSKGRWASAADAALVRAMFSAVGQIHEVEERLLDAVTGLSGSGPAYVFVAIEALADGGVAAGLPRDVALSLAAQTVLGSAKMVVETGRHPGQLKDSVASPGGTTIAGLHELEKGSYRATLMNAVLAAARRSKEMSQ